MNIDSPLRQLGEVNCAPLCDAILGLDESAWHEDAYRQKTFDVHYDTQSVLLLFVDLDRWPDIVVSKESGWGRLADTALPLMNEIISQHYPPGGTVIRAMAAKLLAGKNITPHVDRHESFHKGHRIHIPITTNPRVRFMIDGRPYQFKVGEAYELNNQLRHSVANKGSDDRITFIFDYVPPDLIH